MPFDQHSSSADVVAGIDLKGKIAVVTGASAGLGVETANALFSVALDTVAAEKLWQLSEQLLGRQFVL